MLHASNYPKYEELQVECWLFVFVFHRVSLMLNCGRLFCDSEERPCAQLLITLNSTIDFCHRKSLLWDVVNG